MASDSSQYEFSPTRPSICPLYDQTRATLFGAADHQQWILKSQVWGDHAIKVRKVHRKTLAGKTRDVFDQLIRRIVDPDQSLAGQSKLFVPTMEVFDPSDVSTRRVDWLRNPALPNSHASLR